MGIESLQKMLIETKATPQNGFVLTERIVNLAAALQDLDTALIVAEVTKSDLNGNNIKDISRHVERCIAEVHRAGDVKTADDAFQAYCRLLNEYGLS